MTKKPITAGELQKRLDKDPNYQEFMRKKKEEWKQNEKFFKEEEKLLLQDLKKLGIKVNSVWDLVNNRHNTFFKKNAFLANYSIAYPVLVRHLDYKYHPRVIEGIIRSLTEKQAKEVAQQKILDLFYKEEDKNLKWAMANALTTLMTWRERKKYPEIAEVFRGH